MFTPRRPLACRAPRRTRLISTAVIGALLASVPAVAHAGITTYPRRGAGAMYSRSTASPSSVWRVEAETLTGAPAPVASANATNGTAVDLTGRLTHSASVAAGNWTLSARVRGSGRFRLDVNTSGVGESTATSSWTTFAVPVTSRGQTMTFGVAPIGPGTALQLDWLSIAVGSSGYTTRGNVVFDPSGHPFTPRGINRESLEYQPGGWWFNWKDAADMHSWGVKVVRLQLGQQFWLSQMCAYDPSYATNIDNAIARFSARGILTLLDLHWSTMGQTCGQATQQKAPDQLSRQFWSQVAARYKDNSMVAFDLYNEPHDITYDVWHDGGTVDGWQAVGMQQLYDAVRNAGAPNLVFVSGDGWAGDLRPALQTPLDGYGIVYATHAYCLDCNDQLPVGYDAVVLPTAQRYPVVVTEFGETDHVGTYNANLVSWAETNHLGWIGFEWGAGCPNDADYCLLEKWNDPTPSAEGVPIRNGLLNPPTP